MRVPSIGLTLDERRIVREGTQLAERLMRDYRDTSWPGLVPLAAAWLATARQSMQGVYRVIVRG